MLHSAPYIISFVLGYLMIRAILKNTCEMPLPLMLVLSVGLGLGISGELIFYSFLLLKKLTPLYVVSLNVLAVGLLIFHLGKKNIKLIPEKIHTYLIDTKLINWGIGAAWTGLIFVTFFHAAQHPYGEWDAWAIWNLKTKFLLLSSNPISDILRELHTYTHPDYPLLLPMINTWGLTLSKGTLQPGPFITGMLLCVSCAVLLFAGLNQYLSKAKAFLVSCLLMSHPYYIFFATNQYADILLAYSLLAVFITLDKTIELKSSRMSLLTGLFIGFMTFTKNEGMVIAVVMCGLLVANCFWNRKREGIQQGRLLKNLFLGVMLAGLPTIIFKLFMAPPNEDILPALVYSFYAFSHWENFANIMYAVFREIVDKRWCFIWILLLGLFILRLKDHLRGINSIKILSLIIYFSIVLSLYFLTSKTDIEWWIASSLRRIYFYLLPAVLYQAFMVYGEKGCSEKKFPNK